MCIAGVVNMLSGPQSGMALKALVVICDGDKDKYIPDVVAAGCVRQLVPHLRAPGHVGAEKLIDAYQTLLIVATDNRRAQDDALEAGAVSLGMDLLDHTLHFGARTAAMGALRAVCAGHRGNQDACGVRGVRRLLDLAVSNNSSSMYAASALSEVVRDHADNQRAALDAGALDWLAAVIDGPYADGYAAIELLGSMGYNNCIVQQRIMGHDVLGALATFLARAYETSRVACCVVNLAHTESGVSSAPIQETCRAAGILAALVEHLDGADTYCATANNVYLAIQELVRGNRQNQDAVCALDGARLLTTLLRPGWPYYESVITCIRFLVDANESARSAVRAADGVAKLQAIRLDPDKRRLADDVDSTLRALDSAGDRPKM